MACYSTLASSTRTKPPRHENIKVQLRFVATEYRHEQGNILEVRGGVRSSSRSRGSRSGVKTVMADLSDGMDSMVYEYSKGQKWRCETARLSTSGLLLEEILLANQLQGLDEYLSLELVGYQGISICPSVRND